MDETRRESAQVIRRRLAAVTKELRDYLRVVPAEGVVARAEVLLEMRHLLEVATGGISDITERAIDG
jgi:hypothetical protein